MSPTNAELQAFQRDKLFDLLMLDKLNPGLEVTGLKEQIIKAKAVMPEEDVAYVEKAVNSL